MKVLSYIALFLAAAVYVSAESATTTKAMRHEDAKAAVAELMESGSDSSACHDLAETLIKEVEDAVKADQETIDKFKGSDHDGSACASEGAALVDDAATKLEDAKKAASDAAEESAAAAGADVDFPSVPLSILVKHGDGTVCLPEGTVTSDPGYVSAKADAASKAEAASSATGAIAGFEEALTTAKASAEKLLAECQCKVYTDYTAAWEAAQATAASHEEAYKKGKHMMCVLDGTSADDCDVGATPTVTPVTIDAGCTAAACDGTTEGETDDGYCEHANHGFSGGDKGHWATLAEAEAGCDADEECEGFYKHSSEEKYYKSGVAYGKIWVSATGFTGWIKSGKLSCHTATATTAYCEHSGYAYTGGDEGHWTTVADAETGCNADAECEGFYKYDPQEKYYKSGAAYGKHWTTEAGYTGWIKPGEHAGEFSC